MTDIADSMSSVTKESRCHEPASEAVRVEYGGTDLLPSRAVVEAVAGAAGVDPADLADEAGIVLYDHFDADALDRLVASHPGADIDISLSVAGYEVSVDETAAVVERAK